MQIYLAVLILGLTATALSHPLEDDSAEDVRSRRSLYTERDMSLTGAEKISKRSVNQKYEPEDLQLAATNAFVPSFARRNLRRSRRSADLEDMATAEQVFLPAFNRIYRGKRSASMDDHDLETAASGALFLPNFATRKIRRGRSLKDQDEDIETAATNAFLPAFSRRGFRRNRRSADLEEDMDTAANMYLPAFAVRRGKRAAADDMETAATMAFLPSRAWRDRRT